MGIGEHDEVHNDYRRNEWDSEADDALTSRRSL